jgi:RNase H-like domain found in reverse transcriptase/Reverse transcriptase (RNA-dependent DNA polymerase)/Integrase zinc binding domain/Retroviral aspartyl protease
VGLGSQEEWILGQAILAPPLSGPPARKRRLCLILPITVHLPDQAPIQTQALIDSGAQKSFIDASIVKRLSIPTDKLKTPVGLNMADGTPSTSGPVTHTCNLDFTVSAHHHETLKLNVTCLQTHAVILGIDWLHTHNPLINWKKHELRFLDSYCNKHCIDHYLSSALNLETLALDLALDLDLDLLNPSVDDYHQLQLISEMSEQPLRGCNHHPDTPEPALSLNHVQDSPAPAPVLPEAYAKFASLFEDREIGTLPPHRPYDHTIPLEPDKTAPFGPLYSLSEKELKALRDYIDENLKKGFIRRSESPAGAPVLFVPKKDKDLRLCVDYRELNKITIKNRCPLPLISETLERLREAHIFTKLDLKGAYNLIRVAKGDEWKTAFRTRYGHFEYLVMPFGLTNAPATFQAFLNDVLRECLDTVVVIYLDDILIFSKDEESHTKDVSRVLQLLSDAQLQVKLEKCQFHVQKVEFLGYIISPEGISMDPAKVEAITSWATPKSVRDIQVFLGFANFYRRFIKNFSKIVSPITCLLKKNVPFNWDSAAQSAFDALKTAFSSDPILVHYDPEKPCFLEPDASKWALGMVISQPDSDGVLHPVAFYSRSLTAPERNYHIHDTELLAVVEGLEHWRHFFAFSDFPAIVLTDHKNLEYFSQKRSLSDRQIRYSERLSKFNLKLGYRPGSQNGAADALSRMHTPEEEESHIHDPILPQPIFLATCTIAALNEQLQLQDQDNLIAQIKEAYTTDEHLQETLEALSKDPASCPDYALEENLLFFEGKISVPDSEEIQRQILTNCHDDPAAGHGGIAKTYELVSRSYHWPRMRQFIKNFVLTCDVCQRNKAAHHKPYGLLQPLPVPELPWSSLSMDFIVQLPPSNGYTAILVVVDRLTKMARFIPTTDDVDSDGTLRLFLTRVVGVHGLPDDIVSDRGSVFTSQFTRTVMKALGIKQNLSTAFHPQTDGQTERTNGILEQFLRCYTNYQQNDWSEYLYWAELSYNNSLQSTTNQTPFYALHGYHPRFNIKIPRVAASSPLAKDRLEELHRVQEDIAFQIKSAQETQEHYYNNKTKEQPKFAPGDLVMLKRTNIRTKRPSDKLDVKNLGPFKILEKINSRSFHLELPQSLSQLHPVFHVSLLEPYKANTIPGRKKPPPPPVEIEGQEEFEVEGIEYSRFKNNKLQYLVKFAGYEEPEWQSAKNLENAPEMVATYHAKYPKNPGPSLSCLEGSP